MVFQPSVIGFSAFGHNSKLGVAVLIPVIFLLLEELIEKRQLRYLGLLGLAVGIQLLRAHTQMSYYTFMMIGLYLLYWGVASTVKKQAPSQTFKSIGLVIFYSRRCARFRLRLCNPLVFFTPGGNDFFSAILCGIWWADLLGRHALHCVSALHGNRYDFSGWTGLRPKTGWHDNLFCSYGVWRPLDCVR